MLDELYDVVDKKGKKIGEASWSEVHTKGLLHQNVHGILFRDSKANKTLIKKRTKDALQEPGKYEISVAGHILSGEVPDLAIKRELQEELFSNIDLPENIIIERVGSYFNNDIPNNHEIAYLYKIIYPGPFDSSDAASRSLWINWQDLVDDISHDSSKYAQYSINAIKTYLEMSSA